MIFVSSPQPQTIGSEWATSTSATTVYPSDGVGGTTGTAGSAKTNGKRVVVLGYTSNGTAGTLTITDGAGTDFQPFTLPGATQAGVMQRFGRGIESSNGFGFKNTGGASITVWYQVY